MRASTKAAAAALAVFLTPSLHGAIPQGQRDALVRLYNSTNGASWTNRSGWLGSAGSECSWAGVRCDEARTTVTEIDLGYNNLTGQPDVSGLPDVVRLQLSGNPLASLFPPSILTLTKLENLGLSGCDLTGEIPQGVGALTKLRYFYVPYNALTGSIPRQLSFLPDLEELGLYGNQLTGEVPKELGTLKKIRLFYLCCNQLSGEIPKELGGLSAVEQLYLSGNRLTGTVPKELGGLSTLTELHLDGNLLTGEVPKELGGLKKVTLIDLSNNQLNGAIPRELGGATSLEALFLSGNALSGAIPVELGNATGLARLYLSYNQLTGFESGLLPKLAKLVELGVDHNRIAGPLPDLSPLTALSRAYLGANQLTGPIPPSLGSLPSLTVLGLSENPLGGSIPPELGNLAKLQELYLSNASLTGPIPRELGRLSELGAFAASENELTGSIPSELGGLGKLGYLYLDRNALTGPIPEELGDLANLQEIGLFVNQLTGPIPASFGRLSKLRALRLYTNQLTGAIPSDLGNLTALEVLDLDQNQLSGGIPASLGNLGALRELYLSENQLSGSIPGDLGRLPQLVYLFANGNLLSGSIPAQLGDLAGLQQLQIRANRLSGSIPKELGRLAQLQRLELDYNQLSGPIPSELGDLSSLVGLSLHDNKLSGSLPASIGKLTNLQGLSLENNKLSGAIPKEIGGMASIGGLYLDGNLLTGVVPAELTKLTTLADGYGLSLRYNALRTDSAPVLEFINSKGYNFEGTQTIAPIELSVGVLSTTSVTLRWNQILYTDDGGGYQILYATSPAGPFTLGATTSTKRIASATIGGLTPGTTYTFVGRTFTNPHNYNQNVVTSEDGPAVTTSTTAAGSTTVSLSPAAVRVVPGTNVTVTATLAPVPAAPVTLTLTSSNPSLATVPATVNVPAGTATATFPITGRNTGSLYVTAALPAGLGSGAGAVDVTVDYSLCVQPSIPYFTNATSSAVRAGNAFVLAWTPTLAADPAGRYLVDVYPNGECTGTAQRLTTPQASITIPTENGAAAAVCAVVRAVSGAGCEGDPSGQARVQIQPGPAAFAIVKPSVTAVTSVGAPAGGGTVSFRNIGNQTATVAFSSRIGTFTATPASAPVAPGATLDVSLSFDPLASATAQVLYDTLCGKWTVDGSDRTACTAVTLTTLASPVSSAATAARLSASSSTEVHFIAETGTAPPTQIVTITNTGSAAARVAPTIGPGGSWLIVSGADTSPLGPGASRSYVLAVDRNRRATADGPVPLTTNLTFTTVDGPDEGKTRAVFQLFDEEPVTIDSGRNRPFVDATTYSLFLPSGVSAPGSGTYFLSDGWIRNQGADDARVDLYYTPNGGDGIGHPDVRHASVNIRKYATYRLADFVRGLFSTTGSGSIEIRSNAIASLAVRSTVDSLTQKDGAVARFGAEIPTVQSQQGTSLGRNGAAPLLLTGLKGGSGSRFRTNVILSETSGRSLTVTLRLRSAEGAVLKESEQTVLPYSKLQVNNNDPALFPQDASFDGASLEVEPKSGIGSVAAFATVIDNASQGYTTRTGQFVAESLPAARSAAAAGAARPSRLAVAAAAHAAGRNDSFFTTNMSLTNGTATPATLQLRYVPDGGAISDPRSVTIAPRRTVNYADVIATVFNVTSNTAGMILIEGDVARVVVSSDTSTQLDAASTAKGISPSTLGAYAPEAVQALGNPRVGVPTTVVSHPGLEESVRFRTNLILAEVAGAPAKVRVKLVPPGSTGAGISETVLELKAFERRQINSFIREMAQTTAEMVDVETDVEWISGDGRVLAIATRIDNDPASKRSDVYVLGPTGRGQGVIGF